MKDILEKVNRNDGMTVPDGYFDDFATRMAASLPPMDWENPYVYLAAMFMGVWCMMKMFDMMRPDTRGLNLDNNPVITAAVGNDYFFNDYVITHGDMSEYQLMEDLYETGYIPAAYEYHESSEYVDGDSSLTEI